MRICIPGLREEHPAEATTREVAPQRLGGLAAHSGRSSGGAIGGGNMLNNCFRPRCGQLPRFLRQNTRAPLCCRLTGVAFLLS